MWHRSMHIITACQRDDCFDCHTASMSAIMYVQSLTSDYCLWQSQFDEHTRSCRSPQVASDCCTLMYTSNQQCLLFRQRNKSFVAWENLKKKYQVSFLFISFKLGIIPVWQTFSCSSLTEEKPDVLHGRKPSLSFYYLYVCILFVLSSMMLHPGVLSREQQLLFKW